MAERFVLVPTVQLLGAAVPERYHLIHAAYEDRVAREVEELIPPTMRGLAGLALLRFLDQAFIQDLTERKLVEVALREMPNYGELGPTHPSSQ